MVSFDTCCHTFSTTGEILYRLKHQITLLGASLALYVRKFSLVTPSRMPDRGFYVK
jgi:hypothetical protein